MGEILTKIILDRLWAAQTADLKGAYMKISLADRDTGHNITHHQTPTLEQEISHQLGLMLRQAWIRLRFRLKSLRMRSCKKSTRETRTSSTLLPTCKESSQINKRTRSTMAMISPLALITGLKDLAQMCKEEAQAQMQTEAPHRNNLQAAHSSNLRRMMSLISTLEEPHRPSSKDLKWQANLHSRQTQTKAEEISLTFSEQKHRVNRRALPTVMLSRKQIKERMLSTFSMT